MKQGIVCKYGLLAKVMAVAFSLILALGLTPAGALAVQDEATVSPSATMPESGTYSIGGKGYTTGMYAPDETDFPSYVVVDGNLAWLVTRSYAPNKFDAVWKGPRSEAPEDPQTADVIHAQFIEDVDGAYAAGGTYQGNVQTIEGVSCKASQFVVPLTAEEVEAGEVYFTLRRAQWSPSNKGQWMGSSDHKFEFGELTKTSDATDVPGRTKLEDGTYSIGSLTSSTSLFKVDEGAALLAPYAVVRGASSWLVLTSGNTDFDQILRGQRSEIAADTVGIAGGPIYKDGMSNADGNPTMSAKGMTYVIPIPTEELVAALDDDSARDVYFALHRGEYVNSPYAGRWAGGTYYFTLGELVKTSDSTSTPTIVPYTEPSRLVDVTFSVMDPEGAAIPGATVAVADEGGEEVADGGLSFELDTQAAYHYTAEAPGYDAEQQWFTLNGAQAIAVTLYPTGTKPTVELDTINTELMYGAANTYIERDGANTYLVFAMRTTGYPNLYYGSVDEALAATKAQGKSAWTTSQAADVHEYYLTMNGDRVDSKATKVSHAQFRLPVELDPSGTTKVAFVSIAEGAVQSAENIAASTGDPVDYGIAFFYRQVVVDLDAGTATFGNYTETSGIAVSSTADMVSVLPEGTAYTLGTPQSNEYVYRATIGMANDAYSQAFAGTAEDAAKGEGVVDRAADGTFTLEYVNTLAEGTSAKIIAITDGEPAPLALKDAASGLWQQFNFTTSYSEKTACISLADDVAAVKDAISKLPAPDDVTAETVDDVLDAKAAYDALPAGQKLLVSEEEAARLEAAVEVASDFEAAQARRDADAFEAQVEALPSVDAVKAGDAADIAAARAAYDALSDEAKALVSDEALAKLAALEDELSRVELVPANEENMFKAVNAAIVGSGDNVRLSVSLNGTGYEYAYVGTRDEALADLDAIKAAVSAGESSGGTVRYVSKRVNQHYQEAYLGSNAVKDVNAGMASKYTFELPITDAAVLAAIEAGTGTFVVPMTAISKSKVTQDDWDAALTPRQVLVDLDAKTARVGNYIDNRPAAVTSAVETMPVASEGVIAVSGIPTSNNYGFVLDFTATGGTYDKAFVGSAADAAAAESGVVAAGSDGSFELPVYNVRGNSPQFDAATGKATVAFHVAEGAAFEEAGTWVERTLTIDPEARNLKVEGAELVTTEDPAVAEVEGMIAALKPMSELTLDDKAAVEAARAAYDALTQEQRLQVRHYIVEDLLNAEAQIARLEEAARPATIVRICGENYANETAAAISQEAFTASEYVVLARDDDFADALGATGLAGALDCPIVLTDRMELSAAAAAEIRRLGATRAYIIGGTGAMKAQLEADLAGKCGIPEANVVRLWGENSYDTSLACAKEIVALGGDGGRAIIAMSTNFQDALSMSTFAYKYKVPVVLQTWGRYASDRGFTPEAGAWLTGKSVIVAGGPGAISEASVAPYDQIARLWGDSGYDTSQAIAEWMVARGYLSPENIIVACGAQAPRGVDALAGAALGGRLSAPMLLVNSNTAMEGADTTTVDGFYSANAGAIRHTYVLGGAYVVPQPLYDRLKSITGAVEA